MKRNKSSAVQLPFFVNSRAKTIMQLMVVCLLFVQSSFSQPYYFRHYQVENGLSNNTVFCSIQDKDGFMWFGTKDGLSRFDGYRFKTFNIVNDDEGTPSQDAIITLAMDSNSVLWVGSQKGLYQFDASSERLIPFIDSLGDIADILFDQKGRLWFTSSLTAYCYNFQTKKLKKIPSNETANITAICQAKNGTVWLSTADGYLLHWNEQTNNTKRFSVFSHSPTVSSRWIERIHPGPDNSIFIGTSNQGIKQFDVTSQDYKDVLSYNAEGSSIFVRDILEARSSEYWFATELGVFILNTSTGKIINLKKNYSDPYTLTDNATYCVYQDKEGGIWVGTFFGGVNYYSKQYSVFRKFFPDNSGSSISGNAVREICEDNDGNIWIGTEDAGLNKLDPATGMITRFLPTGTPTGIAYTNLHGLLVSDNELWIGTFEHGLQIMDIKTGKVKRHYLAGPGVNDLKSNFPVSFLQTRSGTIYVGTSNGMRKYDPIHDNFPTVKDAPEWGFIAALFEDHEGTVWVSSHNRGVFYFNSSTGKSGHFTSDPKNKNSLTTNNINAVFEDSYHNIWVATEGGGLCKLNKDGQTFTRYTTNDGLPSNFIFKILEDNHRKLWITTSKGLVNMDAKNEHITVYTQSNGLLNDQFNYYSGYKDRSGQLYFGSVRGMISFMPDAFTKPVHIPKVQVTGFQVHNKELNVVKDAAILSKSIIYTEAMRLPYDQSSFSIDFAAISFASPEMTEYSYLLEGLDKEWTYLKSNRKVYYTNVKPGNYTFKVRAGRNGVWSNDVKELAITIAPPFWATIWAYLIYFAIAGSLLYYLIRIYHNIQENKKEKEIYKAKIDFFTNIAHEIKTPLTLIKGPVENLSELAQEVPSMKEDVVTMERNTNRLVNLVNQILDFRQTETKGFSLDFTSVNMNELLQEAYETFQPLAKKRKLIYLMDLPQSPIFTMADAEALNKVFSNLFSNAVKYANENVRIKLHRPKIEDTSLTIEFYNDGFIVPNDLKEKIFEPFYRLKENSKQKGTGIGLALARSLVELHNGKLYMKEDEKLNVFVLTLPYTNENKKVTTEQNNTLVTIAH